MSKDVWRNELARNTFYGKYALTQSDTWYERTRWIAEDVVGEMSGRRQRILSKGEQEELHHMMHKMKFLPGGRYIYYAGRNAHFFNNCFLLRAEEDTREEWGALAQRATSCLMTGGGIGVDYSVLRGNGRTISRTGGVASGPLALTNMINSIGQNVMQGGSRRSAIYGSINWRHDDARAYLTAKDWDHIPLVGTGLTVGDMKRADFNYRAPLDMTNISLNYDDEFLEYIEDGILPELFVDNVRYALKNGEPGFSFNFGDQSLETLRNA